MNVKTITLTGEETAVKFDKQYPYFWARNPGDSDVYMSAKPGIVPDADGVVTVPAGGGACSGEVSQVNTLYFLGTGKVEVSFQFHAGCPFFKVGGKGGESANGNTDPFINSEGITGYFNMTSLDLSQNKWRNLIENQNDFDLTGGSIENSSLLLDKNSFGSFTVSEPTITYVVFKAFNFSALSDNWTPILTKKVTSSSYKFDTYISPSHNITFSAYGNDIVSQIYPNEYHCACGVKLNNQQTLLYIDGILIGYSTTSSGGYDGEMLINKCIRSGNERDVPENMLYNSIVIGEKYHNNIEVANNSLFLLNKAK